jgi:peptide/nickel transport system substrate-binding protein
MTSDKLPPGGAGPKRRSRRTWIVGVATVGIASIGLAACGSTSSATSVPPQFNPTSFDTSTISWLAANVNDTGTPPSTPSGTLTIAGSEDVSGMLDPQGEYDTVGYTVLRALDRTLVSYPTSSNFTTATSLVADAATEVPTVANGGITNGGLTYTFHLRSGLTWDVTDPSTGASVGPDSGTPVTSQDFLLGLKRECDPVLSGYGNPSYYTATIAGFQSFCTGYEALDPTAPAATRAAYVNDNTISGISTPDSSTIVFTLSEPASDFLNILAMYFAAAAPPSSLNYIPETAGNPIWADGPYAVQAYTPGSQITLVPNPYWGSSPTATSWAQDPVRNRYVSEISINETLGSDAAAGEVQEEIQDNSLDLAWNTVVPNSSLPSLANHSNAGFGDFPSPGITNPYLVFNTQSTADNGALGKVKVRQALEYAIDKVAINKIYGGTDFNEALNQVFSPGAEGYIAGYDPYPTTNDEGNPAKCKTLLKAAGYPNGLTLTDYYRTDGNHPAVFEEVKTDFGKCGVTVNGKPISNGYYTSSGILASSATDLAASGEWDLTEPGWVPDWYGPTNARSILPDLFGTSDFPGTNWGDFSDPNVDNLIAEAEAAPTLAQATTYWQEANKAVMADAPFVPFQTQLTNIMHASSVHNAIYNPFSAQYDITACWVSS